MLVRYVSKSQENDQARIQSVVSALLRLAYRGRDGCGQGKVTRVQFEAAHCRQLPDLVTVVVQLET